MEPWVHGRDTFRYQMDFYYQQALLYFLTMAGYLIFRGVANSSTYTIGYTNPFFTLILIFTIIALISLALNLIRARRLTVNEHEIRLTTRFSERVVPRDNLEWFIVTQEVRILTGGRKQAVFMKLKGFRKIYRIRIGRYEHPGELLARIEQFGSSLPRPTPSQIRRIRRKLDE